MKTTTTTTTTCALTWRSSRDIFGGVIFGSGILRPAVPPPHPDSAAVVVVFTLHRSFYSTSVVHPVFALILHSTGDENYMVAAQTVRQKYLVI